MTPIDRPCLQSKLSEFGKWDKVASSLTEECDKDDELLKAQSDRDLGKDKAIVSGDHKDEMFKHEQAKLAKLAIDKHRQFEEQSKVELTHLQIPKYDNDNDNDGDGDKFIIDDAVLKGKKVLTIKNVDGARVSIRNAAPLVKLFFESCRNFVVDIDSDIITSHLEVHKCSNLQVKVIKKLSTIQLDVCDAISISYGQGTFSGVDDAVYYAGVSDLKIKYMGEEIICDYVKDGAVKVADAGEKEFQFRVKWKDAKFAKESVNKFLESTSECKANFRDMKIEEAEQVSEWVCHWLVFRMDSAAFA